MGNTFSSKDKKASNSKKTRTQQSLSTVEKEAQEKRARHRAVKELITTEETYVNLLGKLITHIYDPLSEKHKIISPQDHRKLFSDIKVIHGLNSEFLKDIKLRFSTWDNNKTRIGDRILEFTPYFRMYQNYMNNYDSAVELLTKLQSKQIFNKYLESVKDEVNNQPLSSLLILPIQRLPRYKLILTEIVKNTEYSHPDLDSLNRALDLVNETTTLINNRMKEFESRQEVRKLERRFTSRTSLVKPHRRFVKEGELIKLLRTGKEKRCTFLLFNDILCYTSGTNDKLKMQRELPIDRAFFIKDIVNHPAFKNCAFEIYSSVKSFIVIADNVSSKTSWMKEINLIIREQLKKPNATQQRELAAPLLVPDYFSDVCQMPTCDTKFTFTNRRHHCRYCGKLMCGKCGKYKLASKRNKSKIVKPVCIQCFNTWGKTYKAPESGEIEKYEDKDSDNE